MDTIACLGWDTYIIENVHSYYELLQIHETDRPKPEEEMPGWMNNDKAKKLQELPKDFPRTYKAWGSPGVHAANLGHV